MTENEILIHTRSKTFEHDPECVKRMLCGLPADDWNAYISAMCLCKLLPLMEK